MWIPEMLLRMQGRECKNAAANNTDNDATNVTNLIWKELAKLYDAYERPEQLLDSNTTSTDRHERRVEQCDDTIDAEVRKVNALSFNLIFNFSTTMSLGVKR